MSSDSESKAPGRAFSARPGRKHESGTRPGAKNGRKLSWLGEVHHWGARTSIKFVPVHGELSFALSWQFSQRIRVNLVSLFGKLARLFFHSRFGKQGEWAHCPLVG